MPGSKNKKTNITDDVSVDVKTRGSAKKSKKRKPSANEADIEMPKRKRQKTAAKPQVKRSRARTLSAKSNLKNPKQTKVKKRAAAKVSRQKSKQHLSESNNCGLVIKNEPEAKMATKIRRLAVDKRNKFVGAHTSIAGGLYKAVLEATEMGAQAFGMFLKSQRQWAAKPLEDKDAEKFKQTCQEHGFAPHLILPHGSYLMNCGSPNSENLKKSRNAFVDELQRCEKLGLALYNFHPGSTCGEIPIEECISRIAESINMAHSKTKYCITVIENMCCQGNTVGGRFSELHKIIDKVKNKSRVGVCLDTCHAFAAGYDLSTEDGFKKTMEEFESVVGLKYLKALHLNDSKGKLGCHLDRHENIGRGAIGLAGFRRVMNDPRFDHIPLILETPMDLSDEKEIRILNDLVNSGKVGCHLDRHENIGKGKIGIEGFRRIMNDPRFNNIPFVLETPQGDYTTGYEKEIRKLYSLCKG